MAISSYEKDGKILWKVYLNIRSRERSNVRTQRQISGIETEKEAIAIEKKLLREASEKIVKKATQGMKWEEVIHRWEIEMRYNKTHFNYQTTTIMDHVNALRTWTAQLLKKPASEICIADIRDVLKLMEAEGKSRSFRKAVKHTVNVVYKWGIEERLIPNVQVSPAVGVKLGPKEAEKVPEILNIDEIRKLLLEAKRFNHEWYPIWATALLTGMRNGELHALLWSDVDFDNNRLTVSKSFNTRLKIVKSTKAGHWRTVPLSPELKSLLLELKSTANGRENVLPRFWEWDKGEQARILRAFCQGVGIKPVCFHALRACFATQLLANDIAPATVMKVCGWRDLKTMQHYIRVAGINERGATDVLKLLPVGEVLIGEVVSLFQFKNK